MTRIRAIGRAVARDRAGGAVARPRAIRRGSS